MIKRTTALYVMILTSILQSTMSLISLASFTRFFWQESATIAATYTLQQRSAWAVAALWSIASIVAGIGMLLRRPWARKLYVAGGMAALLAWFALLPWSLVIAALIPIVATIVVLYSSAAELHLHAPLADAPTGRRTVTARVLFALATALLYSTYLGMILGHGWMYAQFGEHAPLYHFIAWVVVLVTATLVSPPGIRAWQCGVALMVSVVSLTAALIGFLPYTAVFAHYLGAAFHPFEIPWGAAGVGVTTIACVAWLLLFIAKIERDPKRPLPPHGDLPDFV
ncbi:hypothetical protein [Burkholderia territorii]|uniref:hypothetical protein n=1 Tax=Burkholderia territorii TaxID=1503055 RepID=UPI000753FAB0|nr:hypothetical protein [Burkholderia territorii]KWO50050.1 hypothetical protein WT98_17105 [Burkholderia territorii]